MINMEKDKHYQLFVEKHYVIRKQQTLRPVILQDKLYFPTKKIFIKKRLSLIDKLVYYVEDLLLWLKERT